MNTPSFKTPQQKLFDAISKGSLKRMEAALKAGADIEVKDEKGRTALIRAACQAEHSNEMVTLLIEQGADLNAECKQFKITALEHTVSGKPSLVETALTLIKAGANLGPTNSDYLTIGKKIARDCVWKEELCPVLRELLSRNYYPVSDVGNFSIIESAIRGGSSAHSTYPVLRLLLEFGMDPNDLSLEGAFPLHTAVWCCSQEACTILLDHGANPSFKNKRGLTPLESALRRTDGRDPFFTQWLQAFLEKRHLEESLNQPLSIDKKTEKLKARI